MPQHFKKFFIGYLVLIIGLLAFAGGVMAERLFIAKLDINNAVCAFGQDFISPANGLLESNIDTNLYWQVWSILQSKYVNKPSSDENLFYGSLEGMVRALDDPYSVFLRPKTAERFTSDLSGKFFGIGAEIGIRDERLIVIAPLNDTPASRAGIKAGDFIVKINGEDTNGILIEDAVDKIRGPKGTTVILGIFREEFKDVKDFSIARDEIIMKSVEWEFDDDIAIIRVSQFGGDTMELFSDAISEINKRGSDGLILDLRNNPGGFLQTAVQMASEWIENGSVVLQKFADGSLQEFAREGKLRLKEMPTVVLVNNGSASGSEIVAGALQDYDLAELVGEKTFGKGSVQDLEQLKDGSAVKITIAEWYTPKNRGINEIGIEPDVVVEQGEDLNVDNVLERGKEVLRGLMK